MGMVHHGVLLIRQFMVIHDGNCYMSLTRCELWIIDDHCVHLSNSAALQSGSLMGNEKYCC